MKHGIKKNEDGVFSHLNYQEKVNCTPDGSETLLEQFLSSVSRFTNKNFLGTIVDGNLQWQSFLETKNKVEKISSFFNTFLKEKDIIGIFSVNRYEWIISEYASYMSKCINCPLYSTFGAEAIRIIVEESEMIICCVSGDKAKTLLSVLEVCKKSKLKAILVYDDNLEKEEAFIEYGIKVFYFNKIINEQELCLLDSCPSKSDLATICYTSGTSGIPKGVMLTHGNFVSIISAFFRGSRKYEWYNISENDVYLSYLPLAHVMERVSFSVIMSAGGCVGFYRRNPKEIQKDYLIIKPTFIIAVPRVLNLFKQKIEEELAGRSWVIRKLVSLALKYKIWRQKHGVISSYILDILIFNKISKEFGGKIQACLCGSAPLKPDVLSFLQGVLSIRIFQGYGQTETTGATLLQPFDSCEYDNVGIPYPANKIKLRKVDGYGSDCGELLVKGDNVTLGYYRRPEETKALFADGWLCTGDIVQYKNGFFSIIGRCKDIFKTSYGEYIVPEKIENLFIGGIIEDMFVTCFKYSNKLLCIVVCRNKDVDRNELMNYIEELGLKLVKEKKIAKFEIPSSIIILRNGFDTFENADLVTATAKKKRKNIEKYFEKEIQNIFLE